VATGLQVLADAGIATPGNTVATGTNSTVNVAGDYQLRLTDFGFKDLDGGTMTAVKINSGNNLFLNGVALAAGSTVSTSANHRWATGMARPQPNHHHRGPELQCHR
jgi:hypothetical protein